MDNTTIDRCLCHAVTGIPNHTCPNFALKQPVAGLTGKLNLLAM